MNTRKLRRTGLILFAILSILFLTGFGAVRLYLASVVRQALESGVDQSSKGLYRLSIEKLRINLFTGTLRVRGLAITTDSARWETLAQTQPAKTPRKITLTVENVRIFNVHWWQYWKTRDLALNRIELEAPRLDMTAVQDSVPAPEPETAPSALSLPDQLPRLMAPHAKSLRMNLVTVRNGRFLLYTKSPGKETVQCADSIDCTISNIRLTATDPSAAGRTLYAGNVLFSLHRYQHWTVGHRYLFSIGAAQLNGKDSLVEIQHCSMRSVGADSITIFEPRLRQPKVYFTIPETTVQGLDLFRGVHRYEWAARSVLLNGVYVRLDNNMDLPLPLHRRMPNELWRRLKIPVRADTLLVRNADIFYHERTDDEQGKLSFRNANMLVLNLNNDSTHMTDTTPVRVFAAAQFMGTGDLSVALSIPLLSPQFYCPFQATLLNMPFASLNALIGAKNNVRIDAGFADKITVKAQATNGFTRGAVKMYYRDLKISVLKEDSQEKKNISSIIANLLIRTNSDDKKEDVPFRTADIAYPREAADGFLRLLWRASQSGLIKILVNIKVSAPVNDGREKKEKPKKN